MRLPIGLFQSSELSPLIITLHIRIYAYVSTIDTRTVKRRLARLKDRAEEWGIAVWVDLTEKRLPNLLPSIGSRRVPSTSNEIERFFKAENLKNVKEIRGMAEFLTTEKATT